MNSGVSEKHLLGVRRFIAALVRGGLAPLRCQRIQVRSSSDMILDLAGSRTRTKRRQAAADQSADKAAHSKESLVR
jgi:hypothetical protein